MSNLLLGVDIGASNIKIVELREKKDGFAVKNLLLGVTPPGAVSGGTVLDYGAVSAVLKDMMKSAKLGTKEASLALHGDDVIAKSIKVPWNGKGNFQEEFLWGAEQYVGMNYESSSIDVQLVKYDPETFSAEAVVAAANREKVEELLEAAVQSGLSPVVVDIEALALVNLVTFFKGKQKHVNAILDMGHDSVRVIFYEQGYVDAVKTVSKGGAFMAGDLAQDMDIEKEEAEAILRDSEKMSSDADAQACAMAYGSSLGSEIETIIEIYMQERGKEPVDFYACGAVSYVTEVIENIETAMGVSVSHIDPFKYMDLPSGLQPVADSCGAGTFAVAAGLAMRKA